jgi:hypothetical protein
MHARTCTAVAEVLQVLSAHSNRQWCNVALLHRTHLWVLTCCDPCVSLQGVTGFLRQKDYETYFGPGQRLSPGQLLDVVVAPRKGAPGAGSGSSPAAAAGEGDSAGPVFVTVDHAAVAGNMLKDWPGLSLPSLLPGALVTAKVTAVAPDGLLVTFGGYFQGSIDLYNLASVLPEAAWKGRYAPGMKVKARVVYVDQGAKRAGLSLLPHLLNYRLPAAVPLLGQVRVFVVVLEVEGAACVERCGRMHSCARCFSALPSPLADPTAAQAAPAMSFMLAASRQTHVPTLTAPPPLHPQPLHTSTVCSVPCPPPLPWSRPPPPPTTTTRCSPTPW